MGATKLGKQVHAGFILSPFCDDDVVKSSIVDMYAKCGLLDSATLVFESIYQKSYVYLTTMISGYQGMSEVGGNRKLLSSCRLCCRIFFFLDSFENLVGAEWPLG